MKTEKKYNTENEKYKNKQAERYVNGIDRKEKKNEIF